MRTTVLMLGVIAAMGTATAAQAAKELVVNGSFEADVATIANGNKLRFLNNVTGWSGGDKLTFLTPPGAADGSSYLSVYGPFPTTSPDGGNFILADGAPSYSGAFWQTISGLTVGKKYSLNFYQAAGQQKGFNGATTERWSVKFGNDVQLSTLVELPSHGVSPWTHESMTFTAAATSQVLRFLAVGTPNGQPPISFLDGVSLQAAVPEPTTWAMMIAGFGLVGFAARRRRVSTTAA